MNLGVVSQLYPTRRQPSAGIFVREQLDCLAPHVGIKLISPIRNQYWPGETHAGTADAGYPFIRPFMLSFPRWFKQHLYPASMALTLSRSRDFFAGCDLVHAHYAFPDAVATVLTFGARLPIVVTVHGSDVNLFAMKPRLQPAIVEALNAARTIISVSRSLAVSLRRIGVTSGIEIIPNAINTARFTPGDRRESCLRLGLDPERPRLLFIGNFYPVKGIEYLLRAFPEVLRCHPECELALVGCTPGGHDAQKYLELARSLGVQDSMTIREQTAHDAVPLWMRSADVFVLPSLAEGFGIVAAEALACGTPVVATRCGGPEDIVGEGHGFLVPPKDPGSLAEAILRAMDRDGIEPPSVLAASVRARFSEESVIRRILEVYRRVLDRP